MQEKLEKEVFLNRVKESVQNLDFSLGIQIKIPYLHK